MADGIGDKVSDVLYSGYIGQGKKVEEFEQNLSAFLNTDYVSTLNSGTAALHLALHLMKQTVHQALLLFRPNHQLFQ